MLQINDETIANYANYLQEMEKSKATVRKYVRSICRFYNFCGENIKSKAVILEYKETLHKQGYSISTINGNIAAINSFLSFAGVPEWKLRSLRIQKRNFQIDDNEITLDEYRRMIETSEKISDKRMPYILMTLASTGIRISELPYITPQGLRRGRIQISLKGKIRIILIPESLSKTLLIYCEKNKIIEGSIFISRNGRPLHRSYIWRKFKEIAIKAGIDQNKIYPHNFRHFFARTYYDAYSDVIHLADILGHSSVNTIRIYTMRRGAEERDKIEALGLAVI